MVNQEVIKNISAIHNRVGEPLFRMGITHLLDVGYRHITPESVEETKEEIRKNTPEHSIMTPDFQCALMDVALELTQFSIWDLLLYTKVNLYIEGEEMPKREKAEKAISYWLPDLPEKFQQNAADEEFLEEVVRELVEQHKDDYTLEEVVSAFEYVQ